MAVWLNGTLMRYATNVVNSDPYGDIIFLGKIRETDNSSTGTLLFDDYAFQVPRIDDLWVDTENGSDLTTMGRLPAPPCVLSRRG